MQRAASPTSALPSSSAATSRPGLGTKRLLLAEDDRDLRELLTGVLEEGGAIVVAVANGREALELLRTGDFDAAFLDVRMPVLTGLEVLRELQRSGCAVPTILVSSFADHELRRRALALGAARVIAKPVSAIELRQAVCDIVGENV